jgi:dihydrofolate reductase / thymidylate synthase
MKKIAIACLNTNRAIGLNSQLLYKIPSDMQWFKEKTSYINLLKQKNIILMGRKTFESLPNKKPLKDRLNIVISSNADKLKKTYKYTGLKFFKSIDDSLNYCDKNNENFNNLYVCGGGKIYEHFIKNDLLDHIYINQIVEPNLNIGDVFFPEICKKKYNLNSSTKIIYDKKGVLIGENIKYGIKYEPQIYSRYQNSEEQRYLNLLKEVSILGNERKSRNSITYSKFGLHLDFCLQNRTFPLLTTKKVHFKSVVHELLWFLSGKTNIEYLKKNKVNIWDKNTSVEFLKKNNLDYKDGETGPIYGFQWRHFNARYLGDTTDYTGKGVDQIQNVIDLINNEPMSRRIFMSAWNPCQLDEMCLPPCHVSYQFYVTYNERNEKLLSCMMYQRSGDLFLGIPFNIASTALLTYLIGNITNCIPDKIYITIGDAHVYENHLVSVKEQLNRKSFRFPTIKIKKKKNINDFEINDIELIGYNSHDKIKADMIA